MKKTIKWFAASFGIAFGSTAGILANAAPGDLIYEASNNTIEITALQASQAAQWAVNVGAWDGDIGNMRSIKINSSYDEETSTRKFFVSVHGVKSASASELPLSGSGVRVLGVVE